MGLRTDFFIVGTAKAGTSALHEYLSNRPEVCMCRVKEPNFFSHVEIKAQGLYYKTQNTETAEAYHRLFHPQETTRLFGEASVSYLFYPGVAERIHRYNPDAKILICLREPVRRAYSHYCMDYALGLVKETMDTIWKNGPLHPVTGTHYQQYFLVSDYAPQVKRYLDVFPHEQILIIFHEDLCMHPGKTLQKINSFLGLNTNIIENDLPMENVSGIAKSGPVRWLYRHQSIRKTIRRMLTGRLREQLKSMLFSKSGLPEFPESLRRELTIHFRPMRKSLQQLTGLDLEQWEDDCPAAFSEPNV